MCNLQDGFKEAQYWDTATPYHYIRHEEHPSGNILIIGGEDHHTGIKPDEYEVCSPAWQRMLKHAINMALLCMQL